METGETSELTEIDSELVMSFYDQYQNDDLAGCKVYSSVVDTSGVKGEAGGALHNPLHSLQHQPGLQHVSTSIIELKPGSSTCPDVSTGSSHMSSSGNSSHNTWNLPDLLVGLDGITTRSSSDSDSPPLPIMSSSQQLLTSSIPCISLPNLDTSHTPYYNYEPRLPAGSASADSLLEGLGLLSPSSSSVSGIKTELVTCPSPQPQHYSLVDTRGDSPINSPISMDLSQLVSQHNIPAQFELSLSPKVEPGVCPVSLSSLSNIASVSITTPLSLDLIAQHCTLLPPELVSIQTLPPVTSLSPATFINHDQDVANNNIQDITTETIINPLNIKEEDECMSPIVTGEPSPSSAPSSLPALVSPQPDNPSYKRCHLCVRIFSTKANLSSHIRHVHMGEAKHSRVKSIPCPHCNKMFSRKGHMTEHVRTVHEGKKRIYKEVNCQHCGKTFRRKWGLNIHISSAHADVISSLVKQ